MRGSSREAASPEVAMEDDDDIDPEELEGFASHLGMDPRAEQNLMWICRLALKAPVPEGWSAHEDGEGNTYFFHEEKGLSSWEHPSDHFFRKLYQRCKAVELQLMSQAHGNNAAAQAAIAQANQELNVQLEKARQRHAELKAGADRVLMENDNLLHKAAQAEQELNALRQAHAAELQVLKTLSVESGARAADVPRLEQEISELTRKLHAAESEVQAHKRGKSSSDQMGGTVSNLQSTVESLEKGMREQKESGRVMKAALEEAQNRAGELEGRLAKAQAQSMGDRKEISRLHMAIQESALEREEQTRKLRDHVSDLEMKAKQTSKALAAAEDRVWALQEEVKAREREAFEWKNKSDQATALLAQQEKAQRESLVNMGSDSAKLQDALDSANRDVARLSQQLDDAERSNLSLANSESEKSAKLERAESALSDAQAACKREADKASRLAQEGTVLRSSLEQAASRTRDLEDRIAKMDMSTKGSEQGLKATIEEVREREVKLRVELEGARERVRALSAECDELKGRSSKAESMYAESELRRKQFEERCRMYEGQLARASEAAQRTEEILKGVGGGSSGNVSDKITTLLGQVKNFEAALKAADLRGDELAKAKAAVESDLARSHTSVSSLNDRIKKSEDNSQQLSATLAAEREARLRAEGLVQREREAHQRQAAELSASLQEQRRTAHALAEDKAALVANAGELERRVGELEEQGRVQESAVSKLKGDLEALRGAKYKGEAESRKIVAAFAHEKRELEAQLSSERREKKELKAKQALELKSSSSSREQELLRECDKARAECEQERKGKVSAQSEAEQLRGDLEAVRCELEALRSRHDELKEGAAAAYARFVEAEKKLQDAHRLRAELSERHRRMAAHMTEDGDHLREQIIGLESEVTRLGRERQELARALTSMEARAEGAESTVRYVQQEQQRYKLQVDRLRAKELGGPGVAPERQRSTGGNMGVVAGLDDVERENEELTRLVSELRGTLRSVQPRVRELEVLCNQLQTERDVVRAQAEGSKVYWQNQLQQKVADTIKLKEAMEALAGERDRLQRDVERLSGANQMLKNRMQELQQTMEKMAKAGASSSGNKALGSTGVGRGNMGLRMQTPNAVYDTFRQLNAPPLPRAGAPSRVGGRPKSHARGTSKLGTAALNPGQFTSVPELGRRQAQSPYTPFPRPRSGARGYAAPPPGSDMGGLPPGPPMPLLSADVMQNLLGLSPIAMGGTRPSGQAGGSVQAGPPSGPSGVVVGGEGQKFTPTREATTVGAPGGTSLVAAFEQRRNSLMSGTQENEPTPSITFRSGLAGVTPAEHTSTVREISVTSPQVKRSYGGLSKMVAVTEEFERTPSNASDGPQRPDGRPRGGRNTPSTPSVPSAPVHVRPHTGMSSSTANGGHHHDHHGSGRDQEQQHLSARPAGGGALMVQHTGPNPSPMDAGFGEVGPPSKIPLGSGAMNTPTKIPLGGGVPPPSQAGSSGSGDHSLRSKTCVVS